MYVCMFYLGPFSIKGVQYTQCDMILNIWTKVRTWKSEPVSQPRMTYRKAENHMNLDQYKGIKWVLKEQNTLYNCV